MSFVLRRISMLRSYLATVLLCSPVALLAQQAESSRTAAVFDRAADRLVKLEISETGSAAKATIGSGFVVSSEGWLVTNYHVVSKMVQEPGRYRAMVVDSSGAEHEARLLSIDVADDLAVLVSDYRPAHVFRVAQVAPPQGTRLYALGHPRDLGASIVEGTYNGLLKHTLLPRIHFTGSLNPGMSGGPTVTDNDDVIGVNVSTAGNELSFLVPAARVSALLLRTEKLGPTEPDSLLAEVARQLLAYQESYVEDMFESGMPTAALGHYVVPTKPANFFRCWADASRDHPDRLYEVVDHQCSTDDVVFLTDDQETGRVALFHRLLTSDELSTLRFSHLLSEDYGNLGGLYGNEEQVTSYRCTTRNVRNAAVTFRAAVCLRRYKKLNGLYDATLRAVSLGGRNEGLVTTLTLSGVSFSSVDMLVRRYLQRFGRQP